MNIEKLSNAELRRKANECLSNIENEGLPEKQSHIAEAQFCLSEIERRQHSIARKEDARIGQRDYLLEIAVIILIGFEIVLSGVEIYFEYDGGIQEMQALGSLRDSSAAIASGIRPQIALLEKTQNTLDAQLIVAQKQQRFISRQLQLQEEAIAEKQRAPIVELRAYTKTPKNIGGEYRLLTPGVSGLLGYAARSLDDGRSQEIRLVFLVRNVGTAPLLNFRPQVRLPSSAFSMKCLDFGPETHLLGESPEECSAPIAKLPPIKPVSKETPVSTPQTSIYPDFVFQVLVVGPINVPQFDVWVALDADNLDTIYHRIQFMPYTSMSPYAE